MCVCVCVYVCACAVSSAFWGGCGDHLVFACQFGLSCGLKDEF